MRVTVEIECSECMGSGALSTGSACDPRARDYRCDECGGKGRWTVSAVFVPAWEPEQGNGEVQLVHFSCAEWLNNEERSDAEERLWIRYQEREAA